MNILYKKYCPSKFRNYFLDYLKQFWTSNQPLIPLSHFVMEAYKLFKYFISVIGMEKPHIV